VVTPFSLELERIRPARRTDPWPRGGAPDASTRIQPLTLQLEPSSSELCAITVSMGESIDKGSTKSSATCLVVRLQLAARLALCASPELSCSHAHYNRRASRCVASPLNHDLACRLRSVSLRLYCPQGMQCRSRALLCSCSRHSGFGLCSLPVARAPLTTLPLTAFTRLRTRTLQYSLWYMFSNSNCTANTLGDASMNVTPGTTYVDGQSRHWLFERHGPGGGL